MVSVLHNHILMPWPRRQFLRLMYLCNRRHFLMLIGNFSCWISFLSSQRNHKGTLNYLLFPFKFFQAGMSPLFLFRAFPSDLSSCLPISSQPTGTGHRSNVIQTSTCTRPVCKQVAHSAISLTHCNVRILSSWPYLCNKTTGRGTPIALPSFWIPSTWYPLFPGTIWAPLSVLSLDAFTFGLSWQEYLSGDVFHALDTRLPQLKRRQSSAAEKDARFMTRNMFNKHREE